MSSRPPLGISKTFRRVTEVDLEKDFQPSYVPLRKGKIIQELKKASKGVKNIYPARPGSRKRRSPGTSPRRSEMGQEHLSCPVQRDHPKSGPGRPSSSRPIAGIPLRGTAGQTDFGSIGGLSDQSHPLGKGASGAECRVQSVAVRIVCERERAIQICP
jgi:hypothetical protein